MIIAVHILALLFGLFNGRHDVPAVDHFTDEGSNPKEQALFHGSNWKMKTVFCLGVSFAPFFLLPFSFELALDQALAFIAAGLDVWIVFDPVVALTRKNRQPFFYLSDGNKTDRTLKKIFGDHAGAYKLIIAIGLSTAITFFLL